MTTQQTVFATPALVEASPRQWVYWLVTTLLTLSVVGLWSFWFRWITRKAVALSSTQSGTFGTLRLDSKRTQYSRSQQIDPPAGGERAGTSVAKKPGRALRNQAPAAWRVEVPQSLAHNYELWVIGIFRSNVEGLPFPSNTGELRGRVHHIGIDLVRLLL